jgi:hypothetical protein
MKRVLLLFLIFILVGWVFVPTARADFNPIPNAEEFGAIFDQKVGAGQMSKEVYTPNTQALYLDSGICMLVGCSKEKTSGFYYGNSAVASIAMYTNPPADLALWIKDTGQTLGFVPKLANAQGVGFTGLSPLLGIWKAFRNIAYALLAIIMIVIGFMVMFRKKIDPKTVVTVQNALPKIVLTLLLITFSYAIVGLMIDLMYLSIALIASLLIPVSNGALAPQTGSTYMNGGVWTLFGAVLNGSLSSWMAIVNLLLPVTPTGIGFLIDVIPWVGLTIIVGFCLAIFIFITYVRILFMLLTAYVQIIVSLLIGPLQILTEALPGSTGFSSWFKNLFANIAVFPIAAAMMMLATILGRLGSAANPLWTPPLLSKFASSGANTGILGVIAIVLLSQIPGFARAVKEAIKTKPLVGGGSGAGAVGSIVGQTVQYGSMALSHIQQKKMYDNMAKANQHGQPGETSEGSRVSQVVDAAKKAEGR